MWGVTPFNSYLFTFRRRIAEADRSAGGQKNLSDQSSRSIREEGGKFAMENCERKFSPRIRTCGVRFGS